MIFFRPMTARDIAVKIVDEVEVARLSDTAYLTVEDLKKRIEKALMEFAASEVKKALKALENCMGDNLKVLQHEIYEIFDERIANVKNFITKPFFIKRRK